MGPLAITDGLLNRGSIYLLRILRQGYRRMDGPIDHPVQAMVQVL